jgi:hypothetical protein
MNLVKNDREFQLDPNGERLKVHLPPPEDLDEKLQHYSRLQAEREAQRQAAIQEAAVRKAIRGGSKPLR